MTPPTAILATPTRKLFKPLPIKSNILINLDDFYNQQLKDGRAQETVNGRVSQLKTVARQTNLNEPEIVKNWLKDSTWNNKTKTKFADTYTNYLKFLGLTWQKPKYTIAERLPFIPTEQEIDLLIASCGKLTSTILEMLKETAMRIGELTQVKWEDIDFTRKTVNVTPEKGSNPRILPISDKLMGMINTLPKKDRPTVFQPDKHELREYFATQRNACAERLNNPRIKRITFHTLRHWKATMEYYTYHDIMHVRYILGHKNINCTLIYINLAEALFSPDTDEWICKVAHNEEEETSLILANFTFVNKRENPYTAFYKKRK